MRKPAELRPGRYRCARYDGAMTVPTPVFLESSDSLDAADILVVGLRKASDGPRVYAPGLPEDAVSALEALAHAIDAEGGVDSASRQGSPSELAIRSVLFTGLGDGEITPTSSAKPPVTPPPGVEG